MNILLSALNKLAFLMAPIFYKLLFMALTATCIGLIILLIRKLTDKKIAPHWKMALWLLMIVALIVPYRPQSKAAILPAAPVEISYREAYDDARYEAFIGIQNESLSNEQVTALEQERDELYLRSLAVDVLIPLLWLGGVLLCGGFFGISAWKFSRDLNCHSQAPDSHCQTILDECKKQLHISPPVELLVLKKLSSPAVTGLLRPKILLPAYVDEISDRELRCILLHELSHWKRGDLLKNAGLILLQTVYWFDPLLPWLFRYLREDMELLNDSAVLRCLGEEQGKAYSLVLVGVLARSNGLPSAPRLLCMCDEGKNMQRRITMIQRRGFFKKKRVLIAAAALVIILCMSLLFLTQPRSINTVHNKLHFPATEQSPGFILSVEMDESWTIKNGVSGLFHSRLPPSGAHFSSKAIRNAQNEAIGWIFAQNFTPYEEMTFPDENYYQTVFSELRLGSFQNWDPFTSVKVDETSEVGTCAISFYDADLLVSAVRPLTSNPVLESKGILAYDVELGIYVGIGFSADFEISDEDVRTIAESLEFQPVEEETEAVAEATELQISYDNVADEVIAQRFRDPFGEVPDLSTARAYGINGEELLLSELTEDNWVYVTCDGYAYMDDGNFYFTTDGINASDSLQYNYEKYSIGHQIMGPGYNLTMTEASTTFFNEYADSHFPYFEGCSAVFEGSATLTGYCLSVNENEYLYGEGDLLFLPDEKCDFIPIMGDGLFSGGEDPVLTYSDGLSTYYSGNGRELYLGNVADYPDLDFSFLEPGRYQRVRIQIDRLLIRNELNLSYRSSARITDIQVW